MRIGLNLLFLIPGRNGGTETYAKQLVRWLGEIDSENQYVLFINNATPPEYFERAPNVGAVTCNVKAAWQPFRYAWEQCILPWQIKRHKIDLLHSLGYVGPLQVRPAVVTIPDVNFVAFRDTMPAYRRLPLAWFATQSARRAQRVITISEFSKREITRYIGVRPENVSVIHLGPGTSRAEVNGDVWKGVCRRYSISSRYITAFAGGGFPHKNLPRLFRAFAQVAVNHDLKLFIIGSLSPTLQGLAAAAHHSIVTLGYVDTADLASILAHSELCVFPSLYEGFGLPALEIQSSGVPLVCSMAGSLPEVAGDGALYVDPLSIEDLAAKIAVCLTDRELRTALRERGYLNVKRFSWRETARQTLSVYREALAGSIPAQ